MASDKVVYYKSKKESCYLYNKLVLVTYLPIQKVQKLIKTNVYN